ncbi:MAG TPA: alkaline phosphatase family protein [Solirubrobacteraceae bacterium]|nr:alkaline phosphatase family protein [Solirubrobacteraceae bacterium]
MAGLLVLLGASPALGKGRHDPPERVLIIVLDQFRPDYVDEFDMRNVRKLMRDGASFRNAYLGHMASETVITHNVITSGQLPKDMGWADEAFRDSDDVLGEGADSMWISGSLTRDDFNDLIADKGYAKLGDYLKAAHPGTKFIAAGQKDYAVHTSNGPTGDISVTFSGRNFDCDGDGANNWRGPTGFNVPAYLSAPSCGRYYVDSSSSVTYGTGTTSPAWMYPLDGNRFAVGFDPAHQGGDVWVTDAGMAMMEREPWSGMLLTLGSIDKASHMWGGITDDGFYPPGSEEEQAHLRFNAKVADEQVGRLMRRLRDLGQLDETLVVLTTDHGGQPSRRFHGVDEANRGNNNWYYGTTENGTFLAPSPSLAPLIATGNVRFSYQDSAVRTWLTDTSTAAKREAARVMATLPDVIASYQLDGRRYRLERANLGRMSLREGVYWALRGQEIVDTMAAPYAADVVGLLKDDTSYGVAGDHGGAQRPVQEIPIVFAGADVGSRDPSHALRSVDILPTILRELRVKPRPGLDGRAVELP